MEAADEQEDNRKGGGGVHGLSAGAGPGSGSFPGAGPGLLAGLSVGAYCSGVQQVLLSEPARDASGVLCEFR